MLPDSTANDLDQHLSNLVNATPTAQMTHPSLSQTSLTNGSNGLHVPRYLATNTTNEYNLHTSNNGPRSLSDSSQAESPVQDDLLTSNTPNLGGNGPTGANGGNSGGNSAGGAVAGAITNQNFSGLGVNQSHNSYTSSSTGCNGSLYPVLPASLLYSQLYTAANQTHGFHSSQNSVGELQTVMEHISTATGRQQQNLMAGGTDLSGHVGNCGSSARAGDVEVANRQMTVQRAPHHTDNGNSVWRPY